MFNVMVFAVIHRQCLQSDWFCNFCNKSRWTTGRWNWNALTLWSSVLEKLIVSQLVRKHQVHKRKEYWLFLYNNLVTDSLQGLSNPFYYVAFYRFVSHVVFSLQVLQIIIGMCRSLKCIIWSASLKRVKGILLKIAHYCLHSEKIFKKKYGVLFGVTAGFWFYDAASTWDTVWTRLGLVDFTSILTASRF